MKVRFAMLYMETQIQRTEVVEHMDLDHEKRLTAVEEMASNNTRRIATLEKRQVDLNGLAASVAVMAKEQEHIKQDVQEIKNDIKALTSKPGKRWDGMVDKIIFLVIGAFAAWVMAGMPS